MELFIGILLGAILVFGLIALRRIVGEFPGQKPEEYADGFTDFDLKTHLNGKMICEGVIYGPFGRVTSSFTADFDISWQSNVGTMDEHFRYNDGSTQDRQWVITLGDGGSFTTEAADVPGGGKGIISGHTVQMCYRIKLPHEIGGYVLDTLDWMYLTPSGTIVNRSQFRKFGFRAAELIATIQPVKETA